MKSHDDVVHRIDVFFSNETLRNHSSLSHVIGIDSPMLAYGKNKSVLSVGGSVTNTAGGPSAYFENVSCDDICWK
ncbi:hypothetical protein TNIN_254111 [Trichonephila inaurata madagascariensis]|uniref:Uncharacterized protein n=1 Tax=Trichonephila inaurata madagascariensis TaxID=2747483 RepID=A0A8X6I357_9ARAC|nr:hypothetical protein TNIN_254111 [Trichonephila inaurata madagascariensis]